MITVWSFGYDHENKQPLRVDATFDVRDRFKDPHVTPELRELTGLDERVITNVMTQLDAINYLSTVSAFVSHLALFTRNVGVAFGCVGGRHRSVVFATVLGQLLRDEFGFEVEVFHRDVEKPVIERRVP